MPKRPLIIKDSYDDSIVHVCLVNNSVTQEELQAQIDFYRAAAESVGDDLDYLSLIGLLAHNNKGLEITTKPITVYF